MLLLFLPLMLMIAALILLLDGRGVLFAQPRVGRGGEEFPCFKFRTMVPDAQQRLDDLLASDPEARVEWETTRKLLDDPRIIPGVGHLLRKSSLDELPQLINVLRGEMSIVGPRPVVRDELEKYGQWKRYYLFVRPGLTGPWQIGGRNNCSYNERVRKDVDYVVNWSLARDMQIFAQTVTKFITGRLCGAS